MSEEKDKCPKCGAAIRALVSLEHSPFMSHRYECGTHVTVHEKRYYGVEPTGCGAIDESSDCLRRQLAQLKEERGDLRLEITQLEIAGFQKDEQIATLREDLVDAKGQITNLRTVLADLVEIDRRDNLTDPDMAATDPERERAWYQARAVLAETLAYPPHPSPAGPAGAGGELPR